jgi:uncharacterized membrane protein YheB (UPF0754 family)
MKVCNDIIHLNNNLRNQYSLPKFFFMSIITLLLATILWGCDTIALRNTIEQANQVTHQISNIKTQFDDYTQSGNTKNLQNSFTDLHNTLNQLNETILEQDFSEDLENIQNYYHSQYRNAIVELNITSRETFEKLEEIKKEDDVYRENALINDLKENLNHFIDIHNDFLSILENYRNTL